MMEDVYIIEFLKKSTLVKEILLQVLFLQLIHLVKKYSHNQVQLIE